MPRRVPLHTLFHLPITTSSPPSFISPSLFILPPHPHPVPSFTETSNPWIHTPLLPHHSSPHSHNFPLSH
ncbi:hypothetical protein FKM82_009028 [Ascaphus truei]